VVALPGDHHFGGDYHRLANVILGEWNAVADGRP
jgi:type IV secretory pathway VirJ component